MYRSNMSSLVHLHLSGDDARISSRLFWSLETAAPNIQSVLLTSLVLGNEVADELFSS